MADAKSKRASASASRSKSTRRRAPQRRTTAKRQMTAAQLKAQTGGDGYWRPSVTADVVMLRVTGGELRVLLIKRFADPFANQQLSTRQRLIVRLDPHLQRLCFIVPVGLPLHVGDELDVHSNGFTRSGTCRDECDTC